jgi:hypothetical protein
MNGRFGLSTELQNPVYSLHSSSVFSQSILLFFLFISTVYSSSEIISPTCSSLLVWLSTLGFFELRKLVPGFLFDPFFESFPIFVNILFHVLYCFLYFIYLFFIISLVSFWYLLKSSFSPFSSFFAFSCFLIGVPLGFVVLFYMFCLSTLIILSTILLTPATEDSYLSLCTKSSNAWFF